MSLQSAVQIKEAITSSTGCAARVFVQDGEYTAGQILPATENHLSTIQRSALYVVYQHRCGTDDGCGMTAALASGIFQGRTQAENVMGNLAAYGWLKVTGPNRYALTAKSEQFIKRRMGESTLSA